MNTLTPASTATQVLRHVHWFPRNLRSRGSIGPSAATTRQLGDLEVVPRPEARLHGHRGLGYVRDAGGHRVVPCAPGAVLLLIDESDRVD